MGMLKYLVYLLIVIGVEGMGSNANSSPKILLCKQTHYRSVPLTSTFLTRGLNAQEVPTVVTTMTCIRLKHIWIQVKNLGHESLQSLCALEQARHDTPDDSVVLDVVDFLGYYDEV
jgi:hypothetical protein